jgi:hypothetical protein
MLVRLLYASRAIDTSPDAIETILAQSRLHNPECGITGILCYGGGIFLQAIEGGRIVYLPPPPKPPTAEQRAGQAGPGSPATPPPSR